MKCSGHINKHFCIFFFQNIPIKTEENCQYPLFPLGERGGLVVNASDSGSRGQGFEPHSGQTVNIVSLSKAHLLPKSTGNTKEAVAPSQHD